MYRVQFADAKESISCWLSNPSNNILHPVSLSKDYAAEHTFKCIQTKVHSICSGIHNYRLIKSIMEKSASVTQSERYTVRKAQRLKFMSNFISNGMGMKLHSNVYSDLHFIDH